MGIVGGIVVFVMVWWVILFAVLPWGGNHPPEQVEKGHATSAPDNPRMKQKFIATTIISVIVWIIIYLIIESGMISFLDMADEMREQ